MNAEWKITELHAENDKIVSAKYLVEATDGENKVESEGYWYFKEYGNIPIENIEEVTVIEWIRQATTENGVCHITKQLENQLNYLKTQKQVDLPWMPKKFKLPL